MSKNKDKNKNIESLKRELEIDEHLISIPELCARYNTSVRVGLTEEHAKLNLEKFGKNHITPPPTKSNLILLLENMTGWFNMLLWFGSFLCFVTAYFERQISQQSEGKIDNNFLGIILAGVVIVTGLFSYSQEKQSSKIMDSFKDLIPKHATVIRDNVKKEIPVEDLVVGDLVEIKGGDQIPADVRLATANSLKVDNSSLSGESEPQMRSLNAEHHSPLEACNLVFFSTNCLEGSGTGIVIRTGDSTAMGRIAILTTGLTHEITPLANDIHSFIIKISAIAIFFAILFFITCMFIGFSFLKSMIYFITIIVANIPEGLLPTLTLALTLTAKRLAKKNCLIKTIQSVETLGSTSAICTDKTGTLTQNKMTVAHVWYSDQIYHADTLIKNRLISKSFDFWEPLIRNAGICSKSEFLSGQDKIKVQSRKAIGDSSEVAILKFVESCFGSVRDYRKIYKNLFVLPFNSTNKFSLTICESTQSKKTYLLMKGAGERIIEKCSTILIDEKDVELDEKIKLKYEDAYLKLGGCGERVIGFCDMILDSFSTDGEEIEYDDRRIPKCNYRFLGLISMIDPPRPSVPNAVYECRSAGIKIIMVTGDHPITAKAIAKSVGIISTLTREEVAEKNKVDVKTITPNDAGAVVISGEELKQMDEKELLQILAFQEIIFARTSPQQKLSIVEGCQKLGYIVAVTGDGVNDSPALKKANIGVAMGITGSDVSKQAADMILLDDNFSSIVTGIEEGRTIFDNLKKSVCYTLSSKIAQMFPFLMYVSTSVPLGMSAVTILCIDLGTDIFPSVSLAYEPPESDIMRRAPRNVKKDNLINGKLISVSYMQLGAIQICAGFFAYFCLMANNGFSPMRVFGIRKEWDSSNVDDLTDSYGQEWSFVQRKTLERGLYTVFFIAIIMTKVLTLISCKTRKLSIINHGFSNYVLNLSLIVEVACTFLITSTPSVNDLLQMYPIPVAEWFYPIPFSFLVIFYDELRRYLIRNYPRGFFFNQTYY